MQVVFIRHAQSANNALHDGEAVLTRAEFERMRNHDPHLSPLGERQITELGAGVERVLAKQLSPKVRDMNKQASNPQPKRVHLAISPMRRTLLTAVPVVASFDRLHEEKKINLTKVEVIEHIFEIGGCYSEDSGVFKGHPGLNDIQAKDIVPSAHVPESMKSGWWRSSTRETEEELELRVTRTVEWIRRLACENVCDVLFIVIHQDFACICMRRLAKLDGVHWLYNTSLSSFTLHPVSDIDFDEDGGDGAVADVHSCKVVVDWINAIDHLSIDNMS